jgi:hypothetical protein
MPDRQLELERDDAFDPAMVAEEVMDASGASFGVKKLWAAGSVGGGASSLLKAAGGQLAGASTSAGSALVSGGAPSHRDLVSTVVNLAGLIGRDAACALEEAVRQYEAWTPEGETAVASNFRQEALRQLVELVHSPPQIDESKFAEVARRSEEKNAKLDAAVEAKRKAGILDPESSTMIPNAAGTGVVYDDLVPDLTLAEQVAAGMIVVMPKSRPDEGGEAGGREGAIAVQGGVLEGGAEEGGEGRDAEMGVGELGEGAEEEGKSSKSSKSEEEESEEAASSEEEEGSEGAFDPKYVLLDPIFLQETPIHDESKPPLTKEKDGVEGHDITDNDGPGSFWEESRKIFYEETAGVDYKRVVPSYVEVIRCRIQSCCMTPRKNEIDTLMHIMQK